MAPPAVEITAVLQSPPADAILASHVELPAPGDALDRTTIELSGWVVARNSPARAVEVSTGRQLLRTIPLTVPRPDVAGLHPGAPETSGFWALTGTIGLEPTFCLDLRAVFDDGGVAPLASILGRRRPIETSFEPTLRPLLLTSLGRTGTTLALGLLSAHPQVVAHRTHPYEIFPAKYWLHQLRVLAEPANHVESSHPESFAADRWHIGHNPFHTAPLTGDPGILALFGRTYAGRLARLSQESIDELYLRVAESQDQPNPEYFVEKFQPGFLPRIARELYPDAREIFLVRDFRDVLCSVLAFNEKRDDAGFGRDLYASDEDYVSHLATSAAQLLDDWKARSDDSLLVRYEELAARPEETTERMLEYLGLPRGPELVARMVRAAFEDAALDAHRTTRSVEASIGRWRHELSPELRDACSESLDPVLTELGYEPTDAPSQARQASTTHEATPAESDVRPEDNGAPRTLAEASVQLAERDSQLMRTEAEKTALRDQLLAMQATRVWRLGGAYWRIRDRLLRRSAT